MEKLTDAVRDVLAERCRQVEVEGWTLEHDDEHSNSEMAAAAACYALGTPVVGRPERNAYVSVRLWPWSPAWWKPKSRRHDLVRAAALLIAEIERLDRAALSKANGEGGDQP